MIKEHEKRCVDCKHYYGKLSLECGRCDDCSMYEQQEEAAKLLLLDRQIGCIENEACNGGAGCFENIIWRGSYDQI